MSLISTDFQKDFSFCFCSLAVHIEGTVILLSWYELLSLSDFDAWAFAPAETAVVADLPVRSCSLSAKTEQQPHRATKQKHVSYKNTQIVKLSTLDHRLPYVPQ